mgnify:CR=1 FL=1
MLMPYLYSSLPLNNSNSTNPKLRHAKEWFDASWVDQQIHFENDINKVDD